jgi:hypothetical protein
MRKSNSRNHPNTAHIALFMAALACALFPTQCAQAQTLLSDGFESYAPGTSPTSGGWTITLPGGVGDPAAQQVDNTVSASGTNSLRMVGAACNNVNAYHPLSLPTRFRLETSALVRVSAAGCHPWVGGVAAVLTNNGFPYGAVGFFTNGWLCAVLSSNLDDRVQLAPFTTNTWYRIGMTIDLDQRRFDVDINGLRCATSLVMPTTGLPAGIELVSGAGTNAVNWYDDVAVFVPTNGAWLQIYPAVELLFQTELYKSYQLEYANALDATNWYSLGEPFVGTGSAQSLFQPTRDTPCRFYRLEDLGCAYVLSTNALYFGVSTVPPQTIQLLTSPGCPWMIANPCDSWLTLTPTNGIGSGTITVQVQDNTGSEDRNCTVTIGGQSLIVTQSHFGGF